MNQNSETEPTHSQSNATEPAVGQKRPKTAIKIFGIGNAGISMRQRLADSGLQGVEFIAVNTDPASLLGSSATQKIHLESKLMRGMGTGGAPERGQAAAEDATTRLKEICQGAGVVFIIAGLGGGAGTGISAVLARVARETGAIALGFVTTP